MDGSNISREERVLLEFRVVVPVKSRSDRQDPKGEKERAVASEVRRRVCVDVAMYLCVCVGCGGRKREKQLGGEGERESESE